MKRVLLAFLVIIKNATIIMPLMEGMISALCNMIEADNKKKEQENEEKTAKTVEAKVVA